MEINNAQFTAELSQRLSDVKAAAVAAGLTASEAMPLCSINDDLTIRWQVCDCTVRSARTHTELIARLRDIPSQRAARAAALRVEADRIERGLV